MDKAPWPTSNTISGTPEASSITNKRFSEWNPCKASGCSRRLVRATAKLSGTPINSILSDLISSRRRIPSGSLRCHFPISDHKTSDNWCAVLAVQTTLVGSRVKSHHSTSQDKNAVFPTPWPERTATRSLMAMALSASACHFCGVAPSMDSTNRTGSVANCSMIAACSSAVGAAGVAGVAGGMAPWGRGGRAGGGGEAPSPASAAAFAAASAANRARRRGLPAMGYLSENFSGVGDLGDFYPPPQGGVNIHILPPARPLPKISGGVGWGGLALPRRPNRGTA